MKSLIYDIFQKMSSIVCKKAIHLCKLVIYSAILLIGYSWAIFTPSLSHPFKLFLAVEDSFTALPLIPYLWRLKTKLCFWLFLLDFTYLLGSCSLIFTTASIHCFPGICFSTFNILVSVWLQFSFKC